MDEKKVREAIEDFRGLADLFKNKYSASVEHCNTAIEALEKQLPKKPLKSGITTNDRVFHPITGADGVPHDICPNCQTNLCTTGTLEKNKKYMKYCERCGQRLDWSE